MQDLLWTMIPQWTFLHTAATPHLPRPWQVHNHCLSLSDRRGISGSKVSQWELYRCMREKYGEVDFSYMPETFILPRLEIISTTILVKTMPQSVEVYHELNMHTGHLKPYQ